MKLTGSEQTHRLKTNSQTQDIQTHTGALADLGFRTQSKFELFKLIWEKKPDSIVNYSILIRLVNKGY